jgi:hypothetical protein
MTRHIDFRRRAIPIIGRDRCRTDEESLAAAARVLGLPEVPRELRGADGLACWRRLLEQLKFCSRPWAHADLDALSADEFVLAAVQIAHAAAGMAQDVIALRGRQQAPNPPEVA